MKKPLLILCMLAISFPVFGQQVDRRALTNKLKGHMPATEFSAKAEITTSDAKEGYHLLSAMISAEWTGDRWSGYTFGLYTGGRAIANVSLDGKAKHISVQQTTTLRDDGDWGTTLGYVENERQFFAPFEAFTIGTHVVTVVMAGREHFDLEFEVRPIVESDVCMLGAGSDKVYVIFYAYFFNHPPSTNQARLSIDGQPLDVAGSWIDHDLMRIDVLIPIADYPSIFNKKNDRFVWEQHRIRLETDSRESLLERRLSFPPAALPEGLPPC